MFMSHSCNHLILNKVLNGQKGFTNIKNEITADYNTFIASTGTLLSDLYSIAIGFDDNFVADKIQNGISNDKI